MQQLPVAAYAAATRVWLPAGIILNPSPGKRQIRQHNWRLEMAESCHLRL
jgi:hypothetical protein